LAELTKKRSLKGEFVVMIKGSKQALLAVELNKKTVEEHYQFYLDQNIDAKEAMKKVAKDRQMAKSEIYRELLKPSK
ncbi:MAG TPA: 16S rRNA (cytidine(1402)-2'-O)-methyltransferase, partial [Bacilli bacterium]|nr:16S rRNA (cytidine(1402)-2'-O)-methyltransferase [Bacilli bacterium]